MEEAGRVVEGESLSVLLFEHLSGGSNVCQLVKSLGQSQYWSSG